MNTLTLLALFFVACLEKDFKFYQHTDPAAKCVDGTQAGFYYQRGLSNKILIYFEGGALCYGLTEEETLSSCY